MNWSSCLILLKPNVMLNHGKSGKIFNFITRIKVKRSQTDFLRNLITDIPKCKAGTFSPSFEALGMGYLQVQPPPPPATSSNSIKKTKQQKRHQNNFSHCPSIVPVILFYCVRKRGIGSKLRKKNYVINIFKSVYNTILLQY